MTQDQIEEMYSLPEDKQQELNKKAAVVFSELKVAYSNGQEFDHNNVRKKSFMIFSNFLKKYMMISFLSSNKLKN